MIDGKRILALCIPRVNDADCHQLITTLNSKLPDETWRLFVFATTTDLYWNNPSEKGEIAIFDLINYDAADCLIIFEEKIKNTATTRHIVEKAQKNNIPVISIGKSILGCMSTKFEYDRGFEEMVRHVIEVHGARRLHMIAGLRNNEFSEERIEAFRKVADEYGIEITPDMISYGDFWTVPAREATEKLIAENRVPEALICANDTMAISASAALQEHGFTVPDDVIVTGFDGIDAIKYSIPRITSCVCSYEKIAAGIIEGVKAAYYHNKRSGQIVIQPTLLLSESCGCNKEKPTNAADELFDVNNRFYRFQEDEYHMYEMTARVSSCKNIVEVARVIGSRNFFYDMNIVLKKECIDETVDPLKRQDYGNAYGETAFQLLDTDANAVSEPLEFPVSDILPTLTDILEHQIPLIFYGLHFLDIPLGYVCFHFHNYQIENYTKIPQSINALNNTIGSYRNMRYQQYITWQIEEMYKLDNLTGLYNRNGFIREYRHISELPEEQRSHITVIMTDLDGLKYINDIFGHDEGDNAIRVAAHALKACCPKEALCVRFGGDEMLAVYNGTIDENRLRADLSAYLDDYNEHSGKPYKVSSSVGIQVLTSSDNVDLDELIKKSDKLMYFDKAKKKGLLTESTDTPE